MLSGGMVLAMYVAAREAKEHAMNEDASQASLQLRLYGAALEAFIEHYRVIPAVMARDSELQEALYDSSDMATRSRLNLKLEGINGIVNSSALFLLDRNGQTVAASNWKLPTSYVGHNYNFRPYFQQLANDDNAQFFGVGVTTGVPGYFLSTAIRDDQRRLLGVLVTKVDLDEIQHEWSQGQDIVLASDAHGVIFLASQPSWLYSESRPLGIQESSQLYAAQQYPQQKLRRMPMRTIQALQDGARLVHIASPEGNATYIWQSISLPKEGWTLSLLRAPRASTIAARYASVIVACIWLATVFLMLFLHQRRRLARLQQRSRAELETLVKQHTLALHTAQDELIQAAEHAALGYEQSLDHLSQGVSVIDMQLRLVAWNRRYVELFRLPPEMMHVGRPIEDFLRYNASRGLLGDGDTGANVRRRLEHLRAARPYVYERAWPDGTVLEIRGNPLPGGGFVTSYADITGYKNAARNLRTLASTLEKRVAERTSELEEAKQEAERANHSKTRFVAAVVHDLKQPLHAARIFAHTLGERLRNSKQLVEHSSLTEHIEDALAAQDAILSSLLDISRLESGAVETNIRTLALRPLFEALTREFSVVAQSKGLELRCVCTDAMVSSDETLLRRILQNFLSNAIRYTKHGRVLLGCRRCGSSLRIEVWDTGPGIPENLRTEIFEEFRRFDDNPNIECGAGLGLAIVDRSARLLGHPVALSSRRGHGSVFSVTVPIGRADSTTKVPSIRSKQDIFDLHGLRVWCVDDNPRIREAYRILLESWGCAVVSIASETDGLLQAQSNIPPEIVLLDYHLNGRIGPDLYVAFCVQWHAKPPVILISADADARLREQASTNGWGFLNKPLCALALRALIQQLLIRASA